MTRRVRRYVLEPWIDLAPHLEGRTLISLSLGPSGTLYALALRSPVDYRAYHPGASFAKIRPAQPNDYLVLHYDGHTVRRFPLAPMRWNYHHVQPLPGGEFLLVCARSQYRAREDYDQNAHVFGRDGKRKRTFLLGDGIREVQTTASGQLWTSYFDEGVFGNYGWREPVGASGLIRWSPEGSKVWEYAAPYPLPGIADCYAMNAVSEEELWCCYYTDFPLVQVRNEEVVAFWESQVKGAHGFCLAQEHVLMGGGYRDHESYHLLQLRPNHQMERVARYALLDEQGEPLTGLVGARGGTMLLGQETRCYRLALAELLAQH